MKSVSSGWSFLRDSTQVRAGIKYRMDTLDKSIVEVAQVIRTDPDRVSKYLRGVKPSLTNWQIIQLANHLGLEVEIHLKPLSSSTSF